MRTIAILGVGAMGSAIGQRLVEHGARVVTSLEGRSESTAARTRLVGITIVEPTELAKADIVLSVVPPSAALDTARFMREHLPLRGVSPAFLDLNAVSPSTMTKIADVFRDSGVDVIDGTIIGTPPRPDGYDPTIYVADDRHGKTSTLASLGVRLRQIEGCLGSVSALKMCYAGINKGFSGLAAAMLMAAHRTGSDRSLRRELADSLPAFNDRLAVAIPDMLPKARRWVAEMNEISDFLGEDDPVHAVFRAFGRLFAELADDFDEKGHRSVALLSACAPD